MPSHRADTPALRRPRRTDAAPAPRSGAGLRSIAATRPAAPLPSRRSQRVAQQPPRRSPGQLSAPQVGIAGALGLATIAAPISGAMASPAPKAQVNTAASVVSMAPAPAFPALSVQRAVGVESRSVIPSTAMETTDTPALLAARPIYVARASRSNERSVLPGCDGVASLTQAPNGQLPMSSLCTLWDPKHRLRADAAVALAKLNVAYKQRYGDDLCITDSYRTLSSQYRLKSIKPGLAATPGTSEHGWGLAVDLCDGIENFGSTRYEWMRDNAPLYGWDNPTWARPGGSGAEEPWHWEYLIGEGGAGTGGIDADYAYNQ